MNAFLLIVAAGGASALVWSWQNRQQLLRRGHDDGQVKRLLDADVQIVLGVALHEANARSQQPTSLHLLYGLLQDTVFTDAIAKLGGDVEQLEQRVHERLGVVDRSDPSDLASVLTRAVLSARQSDRLATRTDLWNALARTTSAALVGDVAPNLLFLLVHGSAAPIVAIANATEVHVVLRNDDYTTRELVVEIIHDVFGIADPMATELMMKTHTEGRAVIARLDAATAREKLEIALARARVHGFPLWVGVEAC